MSSDATTEPDPPGAAPTAAPDPSWQRYQLIADTDRESALRALATLSRANHALVHATEETALLQQMCETIVGTGGYPFTWYGRPAHDTDRAILPIAIAGDHQDYLGEIRVSWGDDTVGRGPAGRCVRTRQTQTVNDFQPDPDYQPWLEAAARHGLRSSIVLPIIVGDELDGVLLVYAADAEVFDALAQDLLEGLAADLGYGIGRLRGIEDLQRSTIEARAQRERLRATLDSMLDPFIRLDAVRDDAGALVDLRYAEVNEAAVAYNQLTREQMIGARLLDLFPGQLDHGPLRRYFDTIETGEPTILEGYTYEHEILGKELRYDIIATRSGDGIALTWRDVTDRHRAAHALSQSEERYRLLVEYSSDVVCLSMDMETFSWVSEAATKVLGYTADELLGRSPLEFIHPEDVAALVAEVEDSNTTGDTVRPRSRWRRPDGSYQWIEVSGRPFVTTQGERGRVVAVHDVGKEMEAEGRLRESERQYRVLADNSTDAVFIVENDGLITWAAQSVEGVLGWSPDELVGQNGAEFIHPDDLGSIIQDAQVSQTTGGDTVNRLRWRRPDDSYRWFDGRGRLLEPDAPDGRRVVRLRDIDDQVHAEDELAEREQLYRLLAENSSDIILLAESDFTAVWVSPSITEALGWAPSDVIGRRRAGFIHPDDVTALTLSRDPNVSWHHDEPMRLRLRNTDGAYRWMEALARRVPSAEGQPVLHVVRLRDIDAQVSAEQDVIESEHLYRLLAENSSDVVLRVTADFHITWVSPSVAQALDWQPSDLLGHTVKEFIHPDDVPRLKEEVAAAAAQHRPSRLRYRWRASGGRYRWMDGVGRLIDDGSQPGSRVVSLRDIDDQVDAERQRAASQTMFQLLAENASDIVWQVDENGTLLWISPSAAAILGWPTDTLVGTPSVELIVPEDRNRFSRSVAQVRRRLPASGEYRVRRADGLDRWMEITLHTAGGTGRAARVATLRDVDDKVQARQQLEFVLQHDQATGLPTRTAMLDAIGSAIARTADPRSVVVLCIGIDLLKGVNDAYGHSAGDIVVSTVAARVADALGRTHLVGRGTGDEFVAVLADADATMAAEIAERVRIGVHGDLELFGHAVAPTVSIGIALGRAGGSVESMQREATLALHLAKELGRDRWAFADAALADHATTRMALESAIRVGLDRGEFGPWFQPIVSLATGALAGYEALVRWHHDGQVMEPSQFLDVALRTPMITDIDLAMVDPVVAALAKQPENLFFAVNVTGSTLASTDYAGWVGACLERHAVAPERLHVEVTETMLLSVNESVLAQMNALAELGVRWYVDDFGTGYSSISHLRDLPVTGLKLDASFTAGIGEGSHTSRQLATALLGLANGLGLDTVAEGVETESEADYLRILGWRHGQGWLYGKAAPLSDPYVT